MAKDGLFNDEPDVDTMLERVAANFDRYHVASLWKNFRLWVQTTQEKSAWLSVKAMKQKSVTDVAGLTPVTVLKNF